MGRENEKEILRIYEKKINKDKRRKKMEKPAYCKSIHSGPQFFPRQGAETKGNSSTWTYQSKIRICDILITS